MKYNYEEYVLIFKAFSDETRLKIISMLSDKELCACRILERFNITQPTLSYHMKMLTDIGLVNAVKNGSWVNYTINKSKEEELINFIKYILNSDCSCKEVK
jgi:ArsR family transcriptional regulator